ncbi:MAG: hypothetical protein WA129_10865 [Acidovorax sp.]
MDAAHTIRNCIADVTALRIRALQARRFAGTCAGLMDAPSFGPAALFFLQEF